MGILNRIKSALTQPSINDIELYEIIAKEIAAGSFREGLWAKALSEADFVEGKAHGIYMRMAVQTLKQEISNKEKINTMADNSQEVPSKRIFIKDQNIFEGNARVLFIRPKSFVGSLINYILTIDGRQAALLASGEKVEFILSPGKHTLLAYAESDKLRFPHIDEFQQGKCYFYIIKTGIQWDELPVTLERFTLT